MILPIYIMINILINLELNDLMKIRLVSKRFKNIIDKYIVKKDGEYIKLYNSKYSKKLMINNIESFVKFNNIDFNDIDFNTEYCDQAIGFFKCKNIDHLIKKYYKRKLLISSEKINNILIIENCHALIIYRSEYCNEYIKQLFNIEIKDKINIFMYFNKKSDMPIDLTCFSKIQVIYTKSRLIFNNHNYSKYIICEDEDIIDKNYYNKIDDKLYKLIE